MTPTRRSLLGGLLAAPLFLHAPRLQAAPDARLLLVMLRGGMDGLAAVPVPGDPDWARLRGELDAPSGRYALGEGFALCAELAPLGPLWEAGELLLLHAAATPYRERSHFDGQDSLDNGTGSAAARDGWLYRALAAEGGLDEALAMGRSVPLVLRGAEPVACVDPQGQEVEGEPLIDAVGALWAEDPLLSVALQEGVRGRGLSGGEGRRGLRERGFAREAEAVARVLAAPDGPRFATVEIGGWDSHANQPLTLGRRLEDLSESLLALKRGLGAAWRSTVVVVVSEFGRTAAPNGTGGTDHGTGGVALALGGGLRGRRVLGDWPGLSRAALWEERDLRPTTDTRALLAGLLLEHLRLSEAATQAAFPGLAAPLRGLV
ncbi:MAG: DUF1501 domain-containing protein [Alphaproteobacteria bacterium]|nr:DUF1501 domain-containing protein [Alphaproteobacteria bacterium]